MKFKMLARRSAIAENTNLAEALTTVPPLCQSKQATSKRKLEEVTESRKLVTHDDEAFTGTDSFACCTVVGLACAVLLPPRVAR